MDVSILLVVDVALEADSLMDVATFTTLFQSFL